MKLTSSKLGPLLRTKSSLPLLLCVAVLLLPGCFKDKRVDSLTAEITAAEERIKNLQNDVQELKRQQQITELLREFEDVAFLNPKGKGYSALPFDLGVLTISIVEIEDVKEQSTPAAVSLKLAVGNPLLFDIQGLKAKFEYGKTNEEGVPIQDSLQTAEIELEDLFNAGQWTSVDVQLLNITKSDLGFIRIRDTTNSSINVPLQAGLKTLVESVDSLRTDVAINKLSRDMERTAYLTPGASGYSTVRFSLGVLTVSIRDVAEYANGSKVNLQFGNPLASDINGLKATIEYGETNEEGMANHESKKSKTVTFDKSLKSGSWTSTEVVLDGFPFSELGFVIVKDVSYTGVSLLTQKE